jgi:hypothetical protein
VLTPLGRGVLTRSAQVWWLAGGGVPTLPAVVPGYCCEMPH